MILPGPGRGLDAAVSVPPSKSLTNRALIGCAAAGGGTITNPLDSDDTRVLAGALAAAGWAVDWTEGEIRVGARSPGGGRRELRVGDSGTGARLLLALLAATPGEFVLDGSARLRERPMRPLVEALTGLGATCSATDGRLPIVVDGAVLDGGKVAVRPEVSSQFVSALLLAAPLMRHGLEVTVEGELPSRPYVHLTTDTLRKLGATVEHGPKTSRWRVAPGGLRQTELEIEGDWSAAAFFVGAVAVAGGRVEIRPLSPASTQGDRVLCDIVGRAGVGVAGVERGVRFEGRAQRPIVADIVDAPDLFPALAAMAAAASPGSEISGIDHLRHKESDRLSAMVSNLARLGAELVVEGSTVSVRSPMRCESDSVREVSAWADHRIAMAMAVAALAAGPLRLDDPGCVSKSFPSFWKVWGELTSGVRGGGTRP